jgi:hypothetical protein
VVVGRQRRRRLAALDDEHVSSEWLGRASGRGGGDRDQVRADDQYDMVVIDSTFVLSEAVAAFERSLASGKQGKVVIEVAGGSASVLR